MASSKSKPTQDKFTPLAERMRPVELDRFYGQEHLVGKGKILTQLIESGRLVSMIFWGPPGSGKTTLGFILAKIFDMPWTFYSAVLSGIKEIKGVMAKAVDHRKMYGQPTILFLDEIHRFNKAQQAAFLPYVERGDVILFGSTTENPSFEVIAPLLSRMKVLVLNPLNEETLIRILREALTDKKNGLGEMRLRSSDKILKLIIDHSNGDARRSLNTLEITAGFVKKEQIAEQHVQNALQKRMLLYDKDGEEHFNLISALHKSLRNSDVDASLYWLTRMIVSGDDPLYIARRMVRFATEDIGLADPQALSVAMGAKEAYEFLGSPEGELALAEAVIYLASAPKSNRVYAAFSKAKEDVEKSPFEPVPLHLRNPSTSLMREVGYGKGYSYAHDFMDSTTDMDTFPEKLKGRKYYTPGSLGFEKEIKKRIDWWQALKSKMKAEKKKVTNKEAKNKREGS